MDIFNYIEADLLAAAIEPFVREKYQEHLRRFRRFSFTRAVSEPEADYVAKFPMRFIERRKREESGEESFSVIVDSTSASDEMLNEPLETLKSIQAASIDLWTLFLKQVL